ncbi:MAG TPA: hypothetical protein VF183_11450, partial [Acidimicrobiales bacterium]
GTNTDYTTDGDDGFPLLHVAPLDRRGRVKGGPYSQGPIAKGGQFGVLEVTDDGGPLTVALTARDWRGETLLRHEFQVTAGG